VAGIIGIPGRLQSVQAAAFARNPRPTSSEYAFLPSELCKPLANDRLERLIYFATRVEDRNEPHSFGLLRTRYKRPRDCGSAERRNKFPSTDADCHLTRHQGIMPAAMRARISRTKRQVWP
jgi:hypothetical protein